MADAVRRAHNRFPCSRPVDVHQGAAAGRLLAKGVLLNISMSGAYLRIEKELQHRTAYRLRLDGPDGPFELPCRVVREGKRGDAASRDARHYGLVLNPTAGQETALRRLVDLIRRGSEHETPLDRSIRGYWTR